jgi:hypothetical protein
MIEELVIADDMSNPCLYRRYPETYITTLLPEPAMKFKFNYCMQDVQGKGTHVFHGSRIMTQIVSNP